MNVVKTYGAYVITGVITGTIFAALMQTKTLVLFFAFVVYFLGAYWLLNIDADPKIKKKFSSSLKIIFGFIMEV